MSSADNIINDFNIGFLKTADSLRSRINFQENSESSSYEETLNQVSSSPIDPSNNYLQVNNFALDRQNMVIPEKVDIDTASVQETNVNTQEEEEQLSYKNDFLKNMGVDLQNKAELMKALLSSAE
ncbi:hypothetical protein N5U12_04680 [Aliarcobacter butzleri]|uniref:hypothetical protein n=1 Tax=Aliarcobacter butzleri TaxID=28197 RepID=UPI0021B38ACD|nr:hypothetical protein [Aliarcobacter butzleri]MCT7581269.1 hypothetical protein [Aliarcobacter butzleri]